MTEDLGLFPDIRRHLLLDIGRKIFGISALFSHLYNKFMFNVCITDVKKKKDNYLEELLLNN